jgi:membrane-bound lytic murein transglycosylase D
LVLDRARFAASAGLTVEVSSLYHRGTLSKARVPFIDIAKVAAAVLTLALAACAITPPLPSTPLAFSPPAEKVPEPPVVAVAPEREPDPQFATGGDPNSVTNATLQLRSEYGDLWARIRNGFALPDLDTPHVRQAEEWYVSRPEYVARMIERSRRYLYYIVGEVEKRGMPLEAALLPMIESAYNPMAYSSSRASGIWQFIPSTGKMYGMQQNWWIDARRDVVAATGGALDYLQKLHNEFGDWHLALAAYNWGEGSVRRAIAYNQKRGLPTDYLSLSMPAETRNYVPKLQAVKNIVSDPEAFNLELAYIPDAPYFTVVRTSRRMDVKIAAELAEMPLAEFLSLNPQHNRPVIAGADETTILLPYDKAELFAAKLELVSQPMVTWQAYKIRAGETLPQVAARFGLSLETLRTVNGIGPRAIVPIGHAVLVPSQAPSDATIASLQNAVFTTVASGRTLYHRVRKGETISSIADRYEVTSQELRAWNASLGAGVIPGQRLRVVSDVAQARSKTKKGKQKAALPAAQAVSKTTPAARRKTARIAQHP